MKRKLKVFENRFLTCLLIDAFSGWHLTDILTIFRQCTFHCSSSSSTSETPNHWRVTVFMHSGCEQLPFCLSSKTNALFSPYQSLRLSSTCSFLSSSWKFLQTLRLFLIKSYHLSARSFEAHQFIKSYHLSPHSFTQVQAYPRPGASLASTSVLKDLLAEGSQVPKDHSSTTKAQKVYFLVRFDHTYVQYMLYSRLTKFMVSQVGKSHTKITM